MTHFLSASTLYFENSADSGAKRFGGALLNALIFVGVMVGVTFIFVILYKYRCLKVRPNTLISEAK
jgi:presenilin 1